MVWKTVLNGENGDVTHHGGDGMDKISNLFNAVADVDTVDINSIFKSRNFYLNGVISPSSLSADQDNYAPSGWDKADIYRVQGDTSNRIITGIGNATQIDGKQITLRNIGANTLTLMNQHGGSSAANRFDFGGYDYPLFSKCEVTMHYDGTLARWIIEDPSPFVIPSSGLGYFLQRDGLRNNNPDWTTISPATGGTANNIAAVANHPGIVEFTLGTSATGNGFDLTAVDQILLQNAWYHRYDAIFKILQLSNATDNYTLRFGYIDSGSAESTDGVFFRYNHAVNSGNWQLVTRSNGTETATNTSTAAQISNYVKLTVLVYPTTAKCDFYINDVFANVNTTNIPSASGRVTGAGMMFIKTAGTTNTAFLDLDAWSILAYAQASRGV